MSGVRCHNPACGDEGTCDLQYVDRCPVAAEVEAYWRAQYVHEPKPMSQEDRAAHFAWERGNGPNPHE